MKPVILHISADYPDPFKPQKTKAVYNLVKGTPQFAHIVYALNRVTGLGNHIEEQVFEDGVALQYKALPKGLFWGKPLSNLADWILQDILTKGIKPDIIEAHKFTIEGIIGLKLAKVLDCPLVCDLMGNTDVNLLKNKPGFHTYYKEIARYAGAFFPYAPWVIDPFAEKIGLERDKCTLLPVITHVKQVRPAPLAESPKFLSVFHLHGWKNKNIARVFQAMKRLINDYPDVQLDIAGGGTAKDNTIIQTLIQKEGLKNHVRLIGAVQNEDMQDLMSAYTAFIMPSLRESYGQVYAESLLTGVPILYSKSRGIDGYFNADDIGYACDPTSIDDIEKGLRSLIMKEAALKDKIAALQGNGGLSIIQEETILERYSNVLTTLLNA